LSVAFRREVTAALTVAAVCSVAVVLDPSLWTRGPLESYVIAAEDLAAGRIGPALYDDAALAARTGEMTGGRVRDFFSPSPPSLAIVLAPLAWTPARLRSMIWLLLNLGSVVATFWLSGGLRHRPLLAGVASACLVSSAPFTENLERGQIYGLLMSGSAAIMTAAEGSRRLAGAGLAVGVVTKLWGAPAWLVILAARGWPTFLVAASATVGILTLSVYAAGIATWSHYVSVVLPSWMTTPKAAVTAYQTIPSFFAHIMRADPQWNPHPPLNQPALAILAVLLSVVVMLMAMVRAASDPGRFREALAAGIVLAVVLSPLAEQYHYLLLVPSCAVAIDAARSRSSRSMLGNVGLGLALALIFLPLPFKSPRASDWAWGLLAYPRLAGGLLVWTLLVRPPSPHSQLRQASPSP
jgi:hypothetical protein